ncbi:MAG: alpha/beta fold hydrolase [Patescibacteria group bacterium]
MKRVILVHGWDGAPEDGWFPWLKKELEGKGFEVVVPALPDSTSPKIENWVPSLASATGTADEETYFVGHSMGCQTIIRYLETLPEGVKVGGAIFVAGFLRALTGLETDEEEEIARNFIDAPLDLDSVRSHLNRSVAIFSDNDPWVPVTNAEDFKEKLGSEVVIQHEQSHFNEGAGFTELPIALEKLLGITQ